MHLLYLMCHCEHAATSVGLVTYDRLAVVDAFEYSLTSPDFYIALARTNLILNLFHSRKHCKSSLLRILPWTPHCCLVFSLSFMPLLVRTAYIHISLLFRLYLSSLPLPFIA